MKQSNQVKHLQAKKQIGIYFSAHWCPPCRGFTPVLTKAYQTKFKAQGLEIVFASGDNDRATCKSYFEEMGDWLALPYDDRALETKLSSKFKVKGIPTFVILDSDGNLVSDKGRDFISGDKPFPFQPPTVAGGLGDTLLKKVGGKVEKVKTKDALAGKTLALYFSAHWCPPCKAFTPKLAETYKKLKQRAQDGGRKDDFEFVFVSSDRDQSAFDEYYAEMPWLALPFSNRDGKADLSGLFGVRGIPSLVVLDADRNIINKSARGSRDGDPEGLKFPWYPEPLNDVNKVTDGLSEDVSVIAFLDGATAAEAEAKKADLEAVAKKYYAAARSKKADPEFRFFYSTTKTGQISSQIRRMTGVADGSKTIILNLSDDGAFYLAEKEGAVEELLSGFKSKKLERKQCKRA